MMQANGTQGGRQKMQKIDEAGVGNVHLGNKKCLCPKGILIILSSVLCSSVWRP